MKASLSVFVSSLALVAAVSAPGLAQSFQGAPAYGEVNLRSGSAQLAVRAGGALSASQLDYSCSGYIPEAPSLVVDYRGNEDLYLAAGSDEDTTLIVRAPDGTIFCNDDGAGSFNPGVQIPRAQRGQYEVWLGTYAAGVGYPAATFHASTTGFNTSNAFSTAPDPDLPADQRVRLRAGFEGDPRSYTVNVGGGVSLEGLGSQCFGYADEAADVAFRYRNAGAFPLYIAMESDADGVLAIQTPSGEMVCNDDAIGLNPGIHIATPESGRYLIWTGRLSETGPRETGVLTISEIGLNGQDNRLDLSQPALFGEGTLDAGFLPDPYTVQVQAGGQIEANQAIDNALVATGYCTGNLTREPTYELTYEAGSYPLYISANSDRDTTLAINAPDGAWFCDDDSGEGLNPLIEFEDAMSGVYDIYVGTFSEGEAPATLQISEIDSGSGYPDTDYGGYDGAVDLGLPALYGDHDLDAGFLPDPYVIQVQAGGPLDADESGVDADQGWCSGYVSAAPSAELNWRGNNGPLYVHAESQSDTTLAINLPDGSWVCDDDSGDSFNPSLEFQNAQSGIYDIYVGTFSSGSAPARLLISEISGGSDDFDYDDFQPGNSVDLSLTALYGDHNLDVGFLPDPYVIEVQAGGPLDADQSGIESDRNWCAGNVTAAPTVELNWQGEGGQLSIYADSRSDTTLAINLPDGSWVCDDDGGAGLNPALEFQNAQSGIYDIYVGTFSERSVAATLSISEFNAPAN